jgi:predicted transcriptional regulator
MKKSSKRVNTIDKITLLKLVNPNKLKILEILQKEQNQNQLDLKKKLKLSYTETRRYINSLIKAGLIKKKVKKKERGSPVYISLKK